MKTLFTLLLLLVLLIGASIGVAAQDDSLDYQSEQSQESSFGDYMSDTANSWLGIQQFRQTFTDKQETNPIEPHWYPVEEWEIQQCRQDLSTTVWDNKETIESQSSPLLYALTITLQVQQEYNAQDPSTYLTSVSWFIQHHSDDIEYELVLFTQDSDTPYPVPSTAIPQEGPIENKAHHLTGDAGFTAWYCSHNFTKAAIYSNGEPLHVVGVQKITVEDEI